MSKPISIYVSMCLHVQYVGIYTYEAMRPTETKLDHALNLEVKAIHIHIYIFTYTYMYLGTDVYPDVIFYIYVIVEETFALAGGE